MSSFKKHKHLMLGLPVGPQRPKKMENLILL